LASVPTKRRRFFRVCGANAMSQSAQQRANLRCCASCEWIYKGPPWDCPKCGFASYGARFVYGNRAYRFEVTQEPWMDRKMERYRRQLMDEVDAANASALPPHNSGQTCDKE
jgi:hypothetical protein